MSLNIHEVSDMPEFSHKPYAVYPLPLFKAQVHQGYFTYMVDAGKEIETIGYVWYIKGPDVNILVDAGETAGSLQSYGIPAEPCINGLEPHDDPVTPALEKLGLKPQDIDIVILTHLHFDHCALAYLFTNAKFVVQKKELHAALYDNPTAQKGTFKKEVFENLDFIVVDGDANIVDGVWVISTPGHTPGSQSVVVDTPKGRVIISGICTIQMNHNPPEPYSSMGPVITPGIHSDVEMSYKSLLRIHSMADIPVALHDIKWSKVESIPQ